MKRRAANLALAAALLLAGACAADGGGEGSPATTGDPGDPLATEPVAPDGGMDSGTMDDPAAGTGTIEDPAAEDGLQGGDMGDATTADG